MAKKRPGKQCASLPIGKKVLILALCAVALVLAAVGLRAASDPFPRVEVAGFRISREEYLRAMYQARNEVLSDHAAAGISLTDWTAGTALGDPTRLVTDRTLEILTEYYALGTLAVERGYLADAGYKAMKEDLEELNRRRQEALDSGALVTGIPTFSVDDYLIYRASNIRQQFCSDPENPEYEVTPEQLQQRYEADRDALYRQPDSVELAFVLVDAGPGQIDGLHQALESLRDQALKQDDLAAALEQTPQLGGYYREIAVTPESYGYYARAYGDVLEWAGELQSGEMSQVIRQEDRLCLISCISRTVQPYAPLADVESIVAQSVRESRFDDLITARMDETEVRGDLDKLYRFTAEQFR